MADNNIISIIHAGMNDVMNIRLEELLVKYRRTILYKGKSNKLILSGILPRNSALTVFFNRSFSTNNCLKSICTEESIDFINCWDELYNNKPFLSRTMACASIQLRQLVLTGY